MFSRIIVIIIIIIIFSSCLLRRLGREKFNRLFVCRIRTLSRRLSGGDEKNKQIEKTIFFPSRRVSNAGKEHRRHDGKDEGHHCRRRLD